jgi:hypothetical protein
MTRFVITMRQAIHLIESALNTMEGGEVFIPMLPACTRPGLRPGGENRHELLMSGEEATRAVDLTGVSIVLPTLRRGERSPCGRMSPRPRRSCGAASSRRGYRQPGGSSSVLPLFTSTR